MKRKTVEEYVVWRIINLVKVATDDGEPGIEELEQDIRRTLKNLVISLKNGYGLPKPFTEGKNERN